MKTPLEYCITTSVPLIEDGFDQNLDLIVTIDEDGDFQINPDTRVRFNRAEIVDAMDRLERARNGLMLASPDAGELHVFRATVKTDA